MAVAFGGPGRAHCVAAWGWWRARGETDRLAAARRTTEPRIIRVGNHARIAAIAHRWRRYDPVRLPARPLHANLGRRSHSGPALLRRERHAHERTALHSEECDSQDTRSRHSRSTWLYQFPRNAKRIRDRICTSRLCGARDRPDRTWL